MLQKIIIQSLIEDSITIKKSNIDALGNDYPEVFVEYFSNTDAEKFISDLKDFVEGSLEKNKQDNILSKKILEFITIDIASYIDTNKDFNSHKSALMQNMKSFFHDYNESEITKLCVDTIEEILGEPIPMIIVQSPLKIDAIHRSEIRKNFSEQNKYLFPSFKVNKEILGGIKIFDGESLEDYSWSAKIANVNVFN